MNHLFKPVIYLCFVFMPLWSWSQAVNGGVNRISSHEVVSPLEIIRNIDLLLGESRVEATQAGRGKAFSDQVNLAKSLVHAKRLGDAFVAYEKALATAWNRGDQSALLGQIKLELDRLDLMPPQDTRPSGKDENYQNQERNASDVADPEPLDKYEAGARIDAMLAFLHEEIINTTADRLTLQGKLNNCRHLVEMELFYEAQEAYHATIITFLDPRWTSQLLDQISGILSRVTPSLTASESNADMQLNAEQSIAEMRDLVLPLTRRFEQNSRFTNGLDSLETAMRTGNRDASMDLFRSTLLPFAPSTWVDHNSMRFAGIMNRTPHFSQPAPSSESASEGGRSKGGPILYFHESVEGRTVEIIRIMEAHELMTYKRVTHNWGGVFHFINEESTTDTEWLRVYQLYEAQEN
jgi:hypothetical protein